MKYFSKFTLCTKEKYPGSAICEKYKALKKLKPGYGSLIQWYGFARSDPDTYQRVRARKTEDFTKFTISKRHISNSESFFAYLFNGFRFV
jgi:hypothetical protein